MVSVLAAVSVIVTEVRDLSSQVIHSNNHRSNLIAGTGYLVHLQEHLGNAIRDREEFNDVLFAERISHPAPLRSKDLPSDLIDLRQHNESIALCSRCSILHPLRPVAQISLTEVSSRLDSKPPRNNYGDDNC